MLAALKNRYLDSYKGLSREVWLLAAVMFVNRSGTMVIPFLTLYLTSELDFSKISAGVVMMWFGAGSVVGTFIGGVLVDKIGNFAVMFWSLLLGGLMFLVLGEMSTFYGFCLVTFIVSVIADAFRPANMAAVADFSSLEDRTRSVSLIRLAVNAGWAIGPAMAGFLIAYYSYNVIFWVDGLTCVVSSIFLYLSLREAMLGVKRKQEEEKQEFDTSPLSVWRDYKFLIFLGLNCVMMVAFFQLFSTIPVYLKESFWLNEGSIGTLMALNGIFIALLEMPLVHTFEKRFNPSNVVILGALLIGISFFLFGWADLHADDSPWFSMSGGWFFVMIIPFTFITIGEIFQMPFSNSISMARANNRNMGQYMSAYGISFSMAFIIAPPIGMAIASEYDFSTLWFVMAGLTLLAILGYYKLKPYL